MSPPQIKSKVFFGLRTNIKGNAHFISDSETLYPAGGVLVLHDYDKKLQRYIHTPEDQKTIQSIVISPNKKYIALTEKNKENLKPTITIYNVQTLKHEKTLNIPFEGITSREFVALDFTFDSKYLVAITGEPDWMLYYYNWENGKIESQTKAQNPNGQGVVSQVNCNPTDASVIVISGRQTFRLMNVSETVWRQWGWAKAENYVITSCMWLTSERVLFGTNTGMLMAVENGELKDNYSCKGKNAMEIDFKKVEVKKHQSLLPVKENTQESTSDSDDNLEIRCLTVFKKGFAYSCDNGYVYVFEKQSRHMWIRRNIYKVTDEPFRVGENEYVDLNIIQYISINPSQEMLMITTLKTQLYYVKLFEEHADQIPEIPFKELGQVLHNGEINGLALCSWKPVFMTSGKDDRTVRIWNYETEEIELIKVYYGDIYSISLHPTGLFALIGFMDKLRYMVILIDDMVEMRQFSIRNCGSCRFSNNGHMFAAVNGTAIQIYSTISFQNLFNMKGHRGLIRDISWAGTDTKLVSCGSDGAIYEWCLSTGNRTSEVILKDNDFTGCSVNSDGKSAYIVGNDGEVKEVQNNIIIRNLKIIGIKLDNIVLARSDFMLFVTGGRGNVVSIQFPLLDKAVFSEFHMHNASVTDIGLSYDDQTLITVAEDATICIWKITNADGKTVVMSKDFKHTEEIMINKIDLLDKIKQETELRTTIRQKETEHIYLMRGIQVSHSEELNEIHLNYGNAIAELKRKIENMEIEHTHQVDKMTNNIAEIQLNHEKVIEDMETKFSGQCIEEYEKNKALESKLSDMQSSYEERIKKLLIEKEAELQELKDDLEFKIVERDNTISDLEETSKNEGRKHEYIKRLFEDDADREIVEIRTEYEEQLKAEKDRYAKLNAQSELLKMKIEQLQKDMDDRNYEITEMKYETKRYKNSISGLDTEINNLKFEISKRDALISDKENALTNMKTTEEENEKLIFVLKYNVKDLETQLKPKDDSIKQLRREIEDMEINKNMFIAENQKLEFTIKTQNEKIYGIQADVKKNLERDYNRRYYLGLVLYELDQLSSVIHDPRKLKTSVTRILKYKFKSEDEVLKKRTELTDDKDDVKTKLERQISALNKKFEFMKYQCKKEVSKKVEENMKLLDIIRDLKMEIKDISSQVCELKRLQGLSPRRIAPSRARDLINKASQNIDKQREEYEKVLQEKDSVLKSLGIQVHQDFVLNSDVDNE